MSCVAQDLRDTQGVRLGLGDKPVYSLNWPLVTYTKQEKHKNEMH